MKSQLGIAGFSLVLSALLVGSPLNAQDVDRDNNDTTYEAPGARDAVPDMPPIPDVRSSIPDNPWTVRHFRAGHPVRLWYCHS